MSSGVTRLDSGAWGVRVAIGMKVALALAFVVALTVPLEHLDGKGMGFRFPLFMLSTVVVPIAWWRRRIEPYPATADVLIVLPFLLDTLGNLVGSYDTFTVTDDVLAHVELGAVGVGLPRLAIPSSRFLQAICRKPTPGCWEQASARWPSSAGRSPSGSWPETGAGGGLSLTYGDTRGRPGPVNLPAA